MTPVPPLWKSACPNTASRLRQAQAEPMAPIDLISCLVSDELNRRSQRLQGPPGTGKSHLAHAIGHAAIQQGYRVLYRETHKLLEELADATLDGTRKQHMQMLASVPLLIIDDFGMRKLPLTAAEDLLEIIMRRYERASALLTSNRPVDDWGKLLGDAAAVTAMLDRLLHHGHVLKCGPRSWRTKIDLPETPSAG